MEGKEGEGGEKSKLPAYINVCNKYNISVLPPDINNSQEDFYAISDNKILFGLSSVAKVNKATESIIKNRPYESIDDLLNKTVKKEVNKAAVINLIKAGAFDFVDNNRNKLINMAYELRGDNDERLNEEAYDVDLCRKYEKEVIKECILKYPSKWHSLEANKSMTLKCTVKGVGEKKDKNNKLMGFLQLIIDGSNVKGLCFASQYAKIRKYFIEGETLYVTGKKDERDTFIVNGIGKKEEAKTLMQMPKRNLPKLI